MIPKLEDRLDDIATIYEWVMWVKAMPGKGRNGEPGIYVETEMEKFQCVQCGHCCRDLSDAFCTSVDTEDINRWKREKRWDILRWVDIFNFDGVEAFGDLWIRPNTGEEVDRCPWLRKLPLKDAYKCRIHETKPAHCRNYPKSKKHALTTGCKGFGNDHTLDEVKAELESIYRVPDRLR
ncbi:MAG: YkgJ family cysteine cluster protein [Deltaproteobacteria bacterium]|nr:YkgJ family cysteine cluster protein [Deltaproteobacteria bacterium]